MLTTLRLPFPYEVIGYIDTGVRRFYTIWRADSYHPFVTYEVTASGECIYGDYCEARSDALRRLYTRAGGLPI